MKARACFIVASFVLISSGWPSLTLWAQRPSRGGAREAAKDRGRGGDQDKGREKTPKEFQNEPSYKVLKVVNGGTLVAMIEMEQATVKLFGVQFGGSESTQALTDLLKGKEIFLQFEPNAPKQDVASGAYIAYVFRAPDGLPVNQEMIAKGFAGTVPQMTFSKLEAFQAAEKKAKDAKLGLWAGFGGAAKKAAAKPAEKGAEEKAAAAEPAKEEASAADEGAEKVYILKTSKRYHREGCKLLTKTATAVTLAEVKGKYTACPVCKPDKPVTTAGAAKDKAGAPTTTVAKPKKRRYTSQAEQRQMLNQADFGGFDPSGGGGGIGPPY